PFGIGVEHEELAGVQARVAQQFQPIGLGTGKRVLVAKHDSGGIVLKLPSADAAAACAPLMRTRNREFLRVVIEGRRGVLQQDRVANPLCNLGGRARVDVVARVVVVVGTALFDGDQIVRVQGVVFGLALGRDFVVGLREDAFERGDLRVETKCAKWEYLGHEFSSEITGREKRTNSSGLRPAWKAQHKVAAKAAIPEKQVPQRCLTRRLNLLVYAKGREECDARIKIKRYGCKIAWANSGFGI